MLFAIICTDKTGEGLALRAEARADHLGYLKGLGETLKTAGPFMNDEGTEPRGSLVIVEADDLDGAKALADADPYAKAGVFASVEIRAWKWLFGNPEAS